MSDASRVAVYIDFDNVVISRYDSVHGEGTWRRDLARDHRAASGSADPVAVRLAEAEVDLGAIIDYAASFGTVAFTRAYADWSVPANTAYRSALVNWSVDLVQLFPASGTKNGADIRLAVDAVEDLGRHPEVSHLLFVAGDSDYVPLAQRAKRMGRYVVGIGVAGSTSGALVSACDEFIDYAELPGVTPPPKRAEPAKKTTAKKTTAKKAAAKKAAATESPAQADATALLVRAVRVGLQKSDDEWVYTGGVKSQMQRTNAAFNEKSLGFSTFRAFVESRANVVESKVDGNGQMLVRLP
ncbi:MAG TPA: NYN domain-containing protein [Candidatus Nanopelagicales bacterium]|nr:NYN domain-containing protein [Candidatus Nanopelagicales bacterium]